MGCNESKQDSVATGNTIFRRKQSDNGSSKNREDIKTVQETTSDNSTSAADSVLQQQPGDSTDDNVQAEESGGGVPFTAKDMDNVSSSEALKDDKKIDEGGNDKEGVNNGGGDVEDRLICRDSPRHFFSSRKDHHEELGIDGIISEGRSGKSEYNTPRHGAGQKLINLLAADKHLEEEDNNNDNNKALQLADQEQVPEKENGTVVEPVNVANDLVKEGETANTTVGEIKVSTAADDQQKEGDDLNIEMEEKHVDDSQNKDLKTT